jgi:hypothetical protein
MTKEEQAMRKDLDKAIKQIGFARANVSAATGSTTHRYELQMLDECLAALRLAADTANTLRWDTSFCGVRTLRDRVAEDAAADEGGAS